MHIACWVTNATETHSECVTFFFFFAFPRQESLRERASMLRCTYVFEAHYTNEHIKVFIMCVVSLVGHKAC